MEMEETKARIAKGVRRHIWQVVGMGGEVPDALEVMQVAFQILDAIHPEATEATAEESREFIVQCGFSAEVAVGIISDDSQPQAIY